MNEENRLATRSIPRLLLAFSLPAVIGLLVNALYNIVDSMFVGRGVGDLALAGVTVSFPIMTLFIACVTLAGMGATALISLYLGEGRREEAETVAGNAVILFVLIGLGLASLGLLFLDRILVLFGASPEVLPYARAYMQIILPGSVFMAIGTGMNNFIRAEGNPRVAMNTMLIGTMVNIVLDYVFIFIFSWGIRGAALATVLAYLVTSTWVLYHFFAGRSTLKLRSHHFRLQAAAVSAILKLGLPSFTVQVTSSIQQLMLNRRLAHYGGDLALAAIGIIMSITTFLILPAMGISQGAQPLLGFNKGAGQYGRVKETLKLATLAATAVIVVGSTAARLWPTQLIGLFNRNPDLIDLGVHGMGIFFKLIPLVGVQMLGTSYFQSIGKAREATWLALSRQILIFIPLLVILPYFRGLEGVWWSAPLSDLGAFLFTGAWLLKEIRSLKEAELAQEEIPVESS